MTLLTIKQRLDEAAFFKVRIWLAGLNGRALVSFFRMVTESHQGNSSQSHSCGLSRFIASGSVQRDLWFYFKNCIVGWFLKKNFRTQILFKDFFCYSRHFANAFLVVCLHLAAIKGIGSVEMKFQVWFTINTDIPVFLIRLSHVGYRSGVAAGSKQRSWHRDGVERVAAAAGRRQGAASPPAAQGFCCRYGPCTHKCDMVQCLNWHPSLT